MTEDISTNEREYYTHLPEARKRVLEEFTIATSRGKDDLLSLLGQEPYNMITNRDGEKQPCYVTCYR